MSVAQPEALPKRQQSALEQTSVLQTSSDALHFARLYQSKVWPLVGQKRRSVCPCRAHDLLCSLLCSTASPQQASLVAEEGAGLSEGKEAEPLATRLLGHRLLADGAGRSAWPVTGRGGKRAAESDAVRSVGS